MAMNTETFSVFKDQAIKVNSATPVATLLVPDGQWAIFAKLNLDNDSPEVHTVNCKLSAGVDFDQNVARLGPSGLNNTDMAALAFNVVHTFPGTSSKPRTRSRCCVPWTKPQPAWQPGASRSRRYESHP